MTLNPFLLPNSSEWDFRSITEAELENAIRYEYARESELVREAVAELRRTTGGNPFRDSAIFALDYPQFPTPWTELRERPTEWKSSSVSIIPMGEVKRAEGWSYAMNIHFEEKRIEDMALEFKKWLSAEAKRKGWRRPPGRGNAKPWVKLKKLAALRLSRECSDPRQVKAYVEKYQKSGKDKQDLNGVLPKYDSWVNALKDAEAEVIRVEKSIMRNHHLT